MRLFLAINLPHDVRRDLHDATAPLRAAAPSFAWVAEPLLHLTLKFLGDVSEDRVDDVRTCLGMLAARHGDVLLELGGVGAFPNFRRARTVWIGVTPQPRLELLHHDVETGFADLGFEVEGRPFRPHVTLARVKHAPEEELMRAAARAAKQVTFTTEVLIRSIDLMKSDLGPGGPHYTLLASASLRST